MPLSGSGMLITSMDIDPQNEAGFNEWYDREHLVERVSINGFIEARRYIAIDAKPKYLNLYTTATIDTLNSKQYKHALNNQTEQSDYYISRFLNSTRYVAQVTASVGHGKGSSLFWLTLRPAPDRHLALRSEIGESLTKLLSQSGIISAHLLKSDPKLSKSLTDPKPQPSAYDWLVALEGTSTNAVTEAGMNSILGLKGMRDEKISYGSYRLLWDLSETEL